MQAAAHLDVQSTDWKRHGLVDGHLPKFVARGNRALTLEFAPAHAGPLHPLLDQVFGATFNSTTDWLLAVPACGILGTASEARWL